MDTIYTISIRRNQKECGTGAVDENGNFYATNVWAEPYTYAANYVAAVLDQFDDACEVFYKEETTKDQIQEQYKTFSDFYALLQTEYEIITKEYDTSALTAEQKIVHDITLKAVSSSISDYGVIKAGIEKYLSDGFTLMESKKVYDAHSARALVKQARDAIDAACK